MSCVVASAFGGGPGGLLATGPAGDALVGGPGGLFTLDSPVGDGSGAFAGDPIGAFVDWGPRAGGPGGFLDWLNC